MTTTHESDTPIENLDAAQTSQARILVDTLLRRGREEFTGVLRTVDGPQWYGLHIHFKVGHIVDLVPANAPSFLERALMVVGRTLGEKDLQQIRTQAQQLGRDPGELVLEQGLLQPEEISALVVTAVDAEIGNLLVLEGVSLEGVPHPEAHGRALGAAGHLHLSIHPEHAVIGAARRLGLWDAVKGFLPCLKDVYYATPSTFALFQAEAEYPVEVAVLNQLDGQRDLMTALDLVELDPFLCLDAIHSLNVNGYVELINPVQLFQLGCDREEAGETELAARHFERAEERGLDDFDLGYKLAEAYQKLGRDEDAIEKFLAFAEKCAGQFRIDDTIRACRKVIEIDPSNVEIVERYLTLLSRYAKGEDAVREGVDLVRRLDDAGETTRAREALAKLLPLPEITEDALKLYIELCTRTGDDGANHARRMLAEMFHDKEENEQALEVYQGLFVGGEDTPEVRSNLALLHYRAGNTDKAMDHFAAVKGQPGWTPENASPEAVAFYGKFLELDLRDPDVSGWLVSEARSRRDRPEMSRLMRIHRDILEDVDRLADARDVAEKVCKLFPNETADARKLASLERRTGDARKCAYVLETLAKRLSKLDNEDPALDEILDEILEVAPLSIVARRLKLRRTESTIDDPAHYQMVIESALLELVRGNTINAQPLISETESKSPLYPFLCFLAAHTTHHNGDAEKAVEWYHKSGRAAADSGDLGLLATIVDEIEKLGGAETEDLAHFRKVLTPEEQPKLISDRRGPQVIQSTVTGNTSRLRDMKASSGTKLRLPSAPTSKQSVQSSLAKLKGLQGGAAVADANTDADTDTGAGAGDANNENDAPAPKAAAAKINRPAPKPMKGGAAKLKALKAGGAATPNLPTATTDATETTDDPTPQQNQGGDDMPAPLPAPPTGGAIGGSLAKLKGLKSSGSGIDLAAAAAAGAGNGADDASDAGGETAEAPAPTGDADEAVKIDNPTPKNTKKLGGAANKLSALRDQSSS